MVLVVKEITPAPPFTFSSTMEAIVAKFLESQYNSNWALFTVVRRIESAAPKRTLFWSAKAVNAAICCPLVIRVPKLEK